MKSAYKNLSGRLRTQQKQIDNRCYVHGFINFKSHGLSPYKKRVVEHLNFIVEEVTDRPEIWRLYHEFSEMKEYLLQPNHNCGRFSEKEMEDLPF